MPRRDTCTNEPVWLLVNERVALLRPYRVTAELMANLTALAVDLRDRYPARWAVG